MKNKDIYLSGKISGLDFDEAFKLFEEAEQEVRLLGLNPINPMKLNHNHGKTWIDYMEVDLRALKHCVGIYMLDNYQDSDGARIEYIFAHQTDKFIMFQENNRRYPYLYPAAIISVQFLESRSIIRGMFKTVKHQKKI